MVIDACSVILLAKATVLEAFAKWRDIIVPNGVYKEVLSGKDKKFVDALLTEKLVKEDKIALKTIKNRLLFKKILEDFGLGVGEAETIVLALERKGDAVITDNRQGRKAAKVYGLELIGSVDVVVALFKAMRISKEKAIAALKSLKDHGWFEEHLIGEALNEVKNG